MNAFFSLICLVTSILAVSVQAQVQVPSSLPSRTSPLKYSGGNVYVISRIQANFPNHLNSFTCRSDYPVLPTVFAPPRDNSTTSVDETAAYMAPMRDFDFRLSTITDAYLRSNKLNASIGACALTWLNRMAQTDFMNKEPALLSPTDSSWWQLQYERAFLGASIAMHYAAVSAEPGLNATTKANVSAWLKRVALKTHSFSLYREQNDPVHRYNNIYGWMGLHMYATGAIIGDTTLMSRGVYSFKKVIEQIRVDGLMDLELMRVDTGKSFWYHNYALRPLFMLAEISQNRGAENLFNLRNSRGATLITAAKRIAKELDTNMATFPSASIQGSISNPQYLITDNTGQLDWLEIFNRRFHTTYIYASEVLDDARNSFGGKLKTRCGANSTYGFGVKDPFVIN